MVYKYSENGLVSGRTVEPPRPEELIYAITMLQKKIEQNTNVVAT